MTKRIAFFDSHIVEYKTLITQLQSGTEIVVLDDKRDGIEQILIALQGKSNLAAIDIISHGSPGSITLGSGVLNISNLNSYENQLLQIGRHLAEDGDILLYGCKVAQGEIGLDFIEQLSELTGSDVAASISLTGATEMGGDWLLEAQIGSIQAQTMRFDYESVLADDFPNTAATTGSIMIGESSSGIIEEANDRDWFQVSLEAGHIYEFQTTSAVDFVFTTAIDIYDANSSLIDREERFSPREKLVYTATETGTYYLETSLSLTRFSESLNYSYSISATQIGIEIDDYSDSTDTTGSITIGGSSNGNFEDPFDRDWFQVSLTAGRIYEFRLNGDDVAPLMKIYNADGHLLETNNIFSTSVFKYAPESTDTFYIQAATRLDSTYYTISAIQSLDDYASTTATTGSLTIGESISGSIESAFGNQLGFIDEVLDVDWIQVSLTAGQTYEFQLASKELTAFFILFDTNGTRLDVPSTMGRDTNLDLASLDFTATKTGTYYLGVQDASFNSRSLMRTELGSDTGDYMLSVSESHDSLFPADRIFNWAESIFPDLLPNHQESTEILGYYARIYDNGNAVGELGDDLYFYNGNSITLVGAVDNYLSDAIEAGF